MTDDFGIPVEMTSEEEDDWDEQLMYSREFALILEGVLEKYQFEFNSTDLTIMYTAIHDSHLHEEDGNILDKLKEEYPTRTELMREASFLYRSLYAKPNSILKLRYMDRRTKIQEIWPKILNLIENETNIQSWGNRRGRRYRHYMCRPTLPAYVIAEVCIFVLDRFGGKMGWRKIRESSIPIFEDIHHVFEEFTSEEKIVEYFGKYNSARLSEVIHGLIFDGKKHLSGPNGYDDQLKIWIQSTYTPEWFYKGWPVTQRRLRGHATHVNGERGMWISNNDETSPNAIGDSLGLEATAFAEINKVEQKMFESIDNAIKSYQFSKLDPQHLLSKISMLFPDSDLVEK